MRNEITTSYRRESAFRVCLIMRYICAALLALITLGGAAAQSPTATPTPLPTLIPDPALTTAYQDAVVYAGPGETHVQVNLLRPGVQVRVIERSRVGTWVRVLRTGADGRTLLDGWVVSGYLNLASDLRFSHVRVNDEVADANPATLDSQSLKQLYAYPVMPTISETMRTVYAAGQARGNRSNAVSKVGDSLVANPMYLLPMAEDQAALGAYDFLAETLAQFRRSAGVESAAARIGLGSYSVFDAMWATDERCTGGEGPLECEYRLKQPSVALIMFGPNDVKHSTTEEYSERMREIITYSLEQGVIPVLFTFSYHPDDDLWWNAVNFNLALGALADEYDVPLVNLWAAARILPDYGLDVDKLHLKNSGFTYLKFTNGNEASYGVTLQNLLALRVLDEIRRALMCEGGC